MKYIFTILAILSFCQLSAQSQQNYLGSTGAGINANAVYSQYNNRGQGVKICVIENGANLNHPDLTNVVDKNPAQGTGTTNIDHGTSCLGVVGATYNNFGVTGIASSATIWFYHFDSDCSYTNLTNAINAVSQMLSPGDIISLSLQIPKTGCPQSNEMVAIEWSYNVYTAIKNAVNSGIIVVEAAGNYDEDLDTYGVGNNGHHPFDIGSPSSGAIIVGGGNHLRERWAQPFSNQGSNYGARVSLQSLAKDVSTTGTSNYITDFDGTSAATPIVAGGVALLQSVFKTNTGGAVLTPYQVKTALINTGKAQTGNITKHIGPLPDIPAAIQYALTNYAPSGNNCTPPATPSNLSPGYSTSPGAVITNQTPTFTWNAVSGANCYSLKIYQNGSAIHSASVQGTSYTLPASASLQVGGQYSWRLHAHTDNNCNSTCQSGYTPYRYIQISNNGGTNTGNNDNCSGATLLTMNNCIQDDITGATSSGMSIPSCSPATTSATALDRWYKFVANGSTVKVTVNPNGNTMNNFNYLDGVICLYGSCSSNSFIGCQDTPGGGGETTEMIINGLIVGNTYYIRLFDWGTNQPANGGYTICIEGNSSGGSSSGFDCTNLPLYPLNGGMVVISDDNSTGTDDITTYGCVGWSETGYEVAYELDVNIPGTYEFSMDDGSIDLDFFLLNSCDAADCYGYDASTGQFALNQGSYILVVDGDGSNDNGPFDLTITCLNSINSGALDCSNPIPLQCGIPYNGNTNNGNSDVSDYSNTCGGSWDESGPEIVHEIYVPNTGQLEASLDNLNGQNLDVFILSSCDVENDCLDKGSNVAQAIVSPGTYYIVVDGRNGDAGSYTLTATCPTPALSGILDCSNAVSLTCGQSYNGNTSFATNNVENYNGSGWLESGPEVVHTFTLPVDGYISLSLSNMLSQDLDLFLLPNICDPSSCIANGNASINNYYLNAGDYYVVVDGYNGDAGAYTLSFNCQLNIVPTPPSLISPAHNSMQANNSITFEWSIVNNATMYEIQISTDPNFNSFFYANNGLTSTSLTLNNFANAGTTYYWRMQAVNSQGTWSGWSPTYAFVNGVVGGNMSFNTILVDTTCNFNEGLVRNNVMTKSNGNMVAIFPRLRSIPSINPYDSDTLIIIELSTIGNILSKKELLIDMNSGYLFHSVETIITSNQEIFICCNLTDTITSNLHKIIILLDNTYNIIWSREVISPSVFSGIHEINSNTVGLGHGDFGANTINIIYIDKQNGNIINNYGFYEDPSSNILKGNNSLYFSTSVMSNQVRILKSDVNGNVQFANTFIFSVTDTLQQVGGVPMWVCSDGNVLIQAITVFGNLCKGCILIKLDNNGNIAWCKFISNVIVGCNPQNIFANNQQNGNILFINQQNQEISILELDLQTGNFVSKIVVGNSNYSCSCNDKLTNNGSNIAVLQNFDNPNYSAGLEIVKTDLNNNFPCNSPSTSFPPMVNHSVSVQSYIPTAQTVGLTLNPYTVTVQNNTSLIQTFCTESSLSGNLHTEINAPIQSAFVEATGTSYANFATGIDGNYFLAPFQTGCNQTIKPNRNFDPVNGVSTLDVVLINQHLQGTTPLNSPYKIIAADVDKSGAINNTDLNHINQLILGNTTSFPTGESWAFVDAAYNFPNPNNPFPFPDSIQLYNISTDMTGLDFVGMKLGDVDGDALAKLYPNSVEFVFPETSLFENQTLSVPVRVRDFKDRKGFQIGIWLNHNEVQLINIQATGALVGLTNNNFGISHLDENQLRVSWYAPNGLTVNVADTSIIFYLTLKGLRDIDDLSEVIAVSDDFLQSEVYTADLTRAPIEFVFENPKIDIINGIEEIGVGNLFYIFPNPNNGTFTLQKSDNVKDKLTIQVYNLLGQQVYKSLLNSDEKHYNIQLSTASKGIYYVQVGSEKGIIYTQKVIIE